MSRIEPLSPPYDADVEAALRKWMPPGVPQEPLRLFRILERHPQLASRMRVLGAGLLGRGVLPAFDRELVIARVCARCGCEYEWGVHAAAFAEQVGLPIQATVTNDATWEPQHRALLAAVDELHDTAHVSDPTWQALANHYDTQQQLEILVLAGWYHAISYIANGLLIECESWATPYP